MAALSRLNRTRLLVPLFREPPSAFARDAAALTMVQNRFRGAALLSDDSAEVFLCYIGFDEPRHDCLVTVSIRHVELLLVLLLKLSAIDNRLCRTLPRGERYHVAGQIDFQNEILRTPGRYLKQSLKLRIANLHRAGADGA
jgi:hypothetical protein